MSRTRTCDRSVNSRLLYRLSYQGIKAGQNVQQNRQLPNLPGRLQPSTFGVWALNYCVREGNRWAAQLSPPDPEGNTSLKTKQEKGNATFQNISQTLGISAPVRSMPCGTSTPGLSTPWSTGRLPVFQHGRPHLKAGFTLRCFQRLSLPDAATRLHGWRHDRYTVGPSTPVLSYWEQPPSSLFRPRWIWTELSHDVLNPARVPL